MEGSASYWFHFWKEKTQAPTWEGLREALIRRFGGRDRGTMFERLVAVKQKSTVDEYIQDFEMLVAQTKGVKEDQLLEYFSAGLQGEVRSQIRPHNPRDLLIAMEVARDVEEASQGVRTTRGIRTKSYQSWGRYQGGIGTVARSEPFKPGLGRSGVAENTATTRREAPQGTIVSRARSSTMSDGRGRGERNLPYPEYVKRREEGLCFHCGSPYSPEHRYPERSLPVSPYSPNGLSVIGRTVLQLE
ncbi:hypothetical protein LR48_Vigan08g017900 [Vigna angularis]|uniref:Ty3 transposon capsid-like protein domain-containing protein n=1 Tax=Phaseolus angularis TaxID=3914 RepID=A0A0L9V348_PHAAN|nr:hypothetical protein LR48_Vigan08g017900 [Vigna angularis]